MVYQTTTQGDEEAMKRYLVLAVLMLSGCNTLHKFLGTHETPADPVPDIIVLSGVAITDHDLYDIRCLDSSITVEVTIAGVTRTLNRYEYHADTKGAGGGGVSFGRVAYPTFDSSGNLIYLVLTSTPSVPKGSVYKITSVLQHVVKELY